LGDRSYNIHIGLGGFESLSTICEPIASQRHLIVVSDNRVAPLYLNSVVEALNSFASRVDSIVVPEGEASKSLSQCDAIWQEMVNMAADRKSMIVALGGGVVGDLAGFVAAGFARGIPFIQLPTSLLAQVDSSVGGKTGVNLPQAKNMVGAFWQPEVVVIDTKVLQSLDDRNYVAGLAEVIKYGVIMDEPFFARLESNVEAILNRDQSMIVEIIQRCCQCKSDVVEEDEKETSGRRAILNYGHTIGHAIESVFGYGEYLHGEAIAIGMVAEAYLAKMLGMVDQAFLDRQRKLFEAVGLPVECPSGRESALVDAMMRDKKVASGQLNFILPNRIGEVVSVASPDRGVIENCLNSYSTQK
jgi:3-dehydroquinate synthase